MNRNESNHGKAEGKNSIHPSAFSLPPSVKRRGGVRLVPIEVLREQIRVAGLALVAKGKYVSPEGLRQMGVRGETRLMLRLRNDLVALGELPPEARGAQPRIDQDAPVELPWHAVPQPPPVEVDLELPPSATKQSIMRYNAAIEYIFGLPRALAMGALRRKVKSTKNDMAKSCQIVDK